MSGQGEFCGGEKGQPVQSGRCTNSKRHFSTTPPFAVLKKVAVSKGQSEGRKNDPKLQSCVIFKSLLHLQYLAPKTSSGNQFVLKGWLDGGQAHMSPLCHELGVEQVQQCKAECKAGHTEESGGTNIGILILQNQLESTLWLHRAGW